jgi:class 3 adenylate cyclase/tetratricopeptide (TPR) repeat protein
MRCSSCGSELLPGKKFCHVCGAAAEIACPSCGSRVPAGFRFCPDCGFALAGAAPPAPPQAQGQAPIPAVAVEPAHSPPPAAPADDRLARHVPAELARKVRESAGSIVGERKLVTILFCDLVGSTAIAEQLDPEDYRDLLDEYLELAFREVYRVEGIVNQLAGDGFMALFGAPLAHEDAPQRGVSAALAIRDVVQKLGDEIRERNGIEIQVRIGLHTGPVVVGAVGSDLKTDYSAIGDTTNLASRLQSLAAPGTVLISEATHRLVLGFYEVRARGPLDVKGKSEPIQAYEVTGRSVGATPMAIAEARGMTPFVGRDQELAQLLDSWERVAGELPQVFAIVGEAGSGKSRTIYEFRQRLEGRPTTVLEARSSSLTQGVSYAPIVSMLRQFFQVAPGDPIKGSCARIADRVRPFDPDLKKIFPFLCRLLAVAPDGLGDLTAEEIKRQTWEAVTALVAGLSHEAPVLMIFEDLHWIDDASREMVELAAARVARARMMILVSHRPEYEADWRIGSAFTQVRLRPLTERDAAAITAAVAGGTLPAELERAIVERAEGNPFYLEELTRTVIEEGYVVRGDREIRATRPVSEMRVPATVHELLAARLDRVGAHAKRVIQVASVLGRQFRRADLATLLEPDRIDVDHELEALERRGVLHRKVVLSGDEYRFGESLTQEVAYEGLLLRERRALHERVAVLLEGDGGKPSAERSVLLAHHLARSENREGALEALLRAAKDAEEIPSYKTAATLYRQAWDLAAPLIDQPRVEESLQRRAIEAAIGFSRMGAIYASGDPHVVDVVAERAALLAERLGDPRSTSTLVSLRGTSVASTGRERFAEGMRLAERAVEIAERAGLEEHALVVSRSASWLRLLDGRFAEARESVERTLAHFEALAAAGRVSDMFFAMRFGKILWGVFADEHGLARELAIDTYERARAAGNRTAQAGSASNIAWIDFEAGRNDEALEWSRRALEVGPVVSNVLALRTASAITILVRRSLGEPIAADLSEHLDPKQASPVDLALKNRLVVEALLAQGEEDRARRVVEAASRVAGGRLCEMWTALGAAELELRTDGDARAPIARATALAREIGSRSGLATALVSEGERLAAAGDSRAASATLEDALGRARAIGYVRLAVRAEAAIAGLEAPVADVGT